MHIRKKHTFDGVEYITVPVEMWEGAKDCVRNTAADGWQYAMDLQKAINQYEGSEELEVSDGE